MGSFPIRVVLVIVVLYSMLKTNDADRNRHAHIHASTKLSDEERFELVKHRIGRALPVYVADPFAPGPAFEECPDGYRSGIYRTTAGNNVDRCYKRISTNGLRRPAWGEARRICMDRGMHLPMPRFEAENTYIKRLFGYNKYGYLDFWNDENDLFHHDFGYMYGSGDYFAIPYPNVTDYYNWAPGQPDTDMHQVRMSSVTGKWATCQRDDWNNLDSLTVPQYLQIGMVFVTIPLQFALLCERRPLQIPRVRERVPVYELPLPTPS